jgi:type IV pilus assembly protein PilX
MSHSPIHSQQGAVLVVSLIILVAVTLLGITSMKQASTEQAMAGNLRESTIAFQAAEVGLASAEALLATGSQPDNIIAEDSLDPDYFSQEVWTSAVTTKVNSTLVNIDSDNNPRYITKHLGEWNPDKAVTDINPGFGGYGLTSTAQRIDYYRITSRGFGQTGVTARTLQTFFSRIQ